VSHSHRFLEDQSKNCTFPIPRLQLSTVEQLMHLFGASPALLAGLLSRMDGYPSIGVGTSMLKKWSESNTEENASLLSIREWASGPHRRAFIED